MLDEYDRVCRPSALDETPCSVAEQRQHSSLNRYFNVLPFDFNRVRLQVGDKAANAIAALCSSVGCEWAECCISKLSSQHEAAFQGYGARAAT